MNVNHPVYPIALILLLSLMVSIKVHLSRAHPDWIPASAGMTMKNNPFLISVSPAKAGAQGFYKFFKLLDSGACPGLDPRSAGMTKNGIFRLFTKPSFP
jgi:hypothetical protein